jgi:membrane associated rhomboid family serine protease
MSEKVTIKVFLFPFFLVLLLVGVEAIEQWGAYYWAQYGVLPRSLKGLRGIFLSPLLHSDWKHLFNNAVPLVVLGASLRYFYKDIAKEIWLWSWLMSGLWLWTIGRPNYHIGASGLVYALAAFLFFSGLFRRHSKLMAISFVVVFLYGGMVWGLFPIKEQMSWEGHLAGAMAGIILAWWFRQEGPPKQKYQYEIEEELEAEQAQQIHYHYKED